MTVADPMLTPGQLALLLNVSERQAQKLCAAGKLPAKNVGLGRVACWRVRMSDAQRYIETPDNAARPAPPERRRALPSHVRRLA